ncbi:MAG TPA: cytochrome ubiquinol oxidase subunit I [Nitrospirota bacterium]
MDTALLSRIQFGLTAGFHFIFPPLTIGLAWLIFYFKSMYLKTGNEDYWKISRFWTKLFAIGFVIGVATGIPMEFQFGTNWSSYARYVGDVFGAPLAAEVIFSFFLESFFLAILVFGADKVSKKAQWFAALMVAFGSTLSAFWIIVAGSWMQTPAGFEIINGRAQLMDFQAALFNPSVGERFTHVITAALTSGAFYMMGISALFMLRRRNLAFAKKSMSAALVVAAITSLLQIPIGHAHAVEVAKLQPVKLAAFEGRYTTTAGAPLCLFGFPSKDEQCIKGAVEVPKLLSILIYGDPNMVVAGLDSVPESERPPVALTFFTFRGMAGLGTYMLALCALGIFLMARGTLTESTLFQRLALYSIPVPLLANEFGWMSAEIGRQPWIVQGLMRTDQAFSKVVPAGQVLFSIILISVIYAFLFVLWVYFIRQAVEAGPESLSGEASGKEAI